MLKETIVSGSPTEVGVSVDVKLVGKKTIERSDGKARRVVDRRKVE